MNFYLQYLLFITLLTVNVFCEDDVEVKSARVESCPGCSLNRLSEVKKFIYEDLPKYNIEFKKIHGASPELVLLNSRDQEIERIPLSKLSRSECNELLESKGFNVIEVSEGRSEF